MTPRRPILLAAFAAAALFAAGCTATQTSASDVQSGAGTPPGLDERATDDPGVVSDADGESDPVAIGSLVMIGDSITVASRSALEERFAALGLDSVAIQAQNGKRIAQDDRDNSSGTTIARGLVDTAAAGDVDHSDVVWVIALGTNDVNQYADESEIASVVDELLAEVPASAPLIWVDTFYANDTEATDLVNGAIAERLDARGNAMVASWSEVAEYDGVLRSDGVHPSTTGVAVFAATVAATVDDLLES